MRIRRSGFKSWLSSFQHVTWSHHFDLCELPSLSVKWVCSGFLNPRAVASLSCDSVWLHSEVRHYCYCFCSYRFIVISNSEWYRGLGIKHAFCLGVFTTSIHCGDTVHMPPCTDLTGGLEGLSAETSRVTEPLLAALLERSLLVSPLTEPPWKAVTAAFCTLCACTWVCVSETHSFGLYRIACALSPLTSAILSPASPCVVLLFWLGWENSDVFLKQNYKKCILGSYFT